jgi:S-(hydroxymethyl)glutathione dehydrogenase / alcohol dehydrogenase
MRKMKAAILVEQRKPLVIDEVELPEKLEYGQVLVKIFYTSICGAQINEYLGTKGPDKFLPHLLGHEASAIVEACGAGVTNVKPGDNVVLHWRKGDGIQAPVPKYQWKGRPLNAGWVTTFSEYSIVSENRMTPVPAGADMRTAPLYGCAVTTAFGLLQNEAHVKSGESIVVVGVGGLGVAVVMAANCAAANPIVAVDVNDFKLGKAKEFGATHLINSKKEDVAAALRKLFPKGPDVMVETTGINSVKEQCCDLVSPSGKVVFVGVTAKGEKMLLDSTPLHFGKKIVASYGGSSNPAYDIPRLIQLEMAGRFDLKGMITQELSLDKINDAIELMRAGETLRCLLAVGK